MATLTDRLQSQTNHTQESKNSDEARSSPIVIVGRRSITSRYPFAPKGPVQAICFA